MAERVKLTFQKSEHGDKVTITKDGGFTVEDMNRLTETVEKLFHDEEEVENEEVEDAEDTDQSSKIGAKTAMKKGPLGDKTPPAGRGQVAAKTPEGTGFTKEGDVDRRTLRGTPQEPDPDQQKFIKNVERQLGKGGQPEARQ